MHHQITLSLHLNWHVLCVSLPSYLFCLHPSYSSFLIFLHFCLLSVSSEIFHSMNCIVIPQHPIFWPWFFFYSHFSCFLLHGIYFREGSEGELHPSYWSPTYSPSSGICRIPSDSSQPTKWLEEVKNGSQRSEASVPYLDIKYCNKGFLRVCVCGGEQSNGSFHYQCDTIFKYFEYWDDKRHKVSVLIKGWPYLKKGGKSYPCIVLLWPALLNLGWYFGSLDHHEHNDHCCSAPWCKSYKDTPRQPVQHSWKTRLGQLTSLSAFKNPFHSITWILMHLQTCM